MAVDDRLLEILVCPASRVPVKRLPKDELAVLNQHRERSGLVHVDGSKVKHAVEEALITTDGKMVYAVSAGIPVMLVDQGIPAHQIPGW